MKKYVYKIMLLISNFTGDGLDTIPLKDFVGKEYEFNTRGKVKKVIRERSSQYPNKLYIAKIEKEDDSNVKESS